MFVLPAEGRPVRDPVTKRHIPASGAEVPESTYWLRRLRCGDVVIAPAFVVPMSPITSDLENT